jgi:hypothetical protein
MKSLVAIAVGIILVGLLVLFAAHPFQSQAQNGKNHDSKSSSSSVLKKNKPISSTSPLSLYPPVRVNCNTNASWVPYTVDYTVTGMGCVAPSLSSGNTFMFCNGSIMQHATDVTFNCYRSGYYSLNDLLACRGSTNADSNPQNLALNYTCLLPDVAGSNNNPVYSCSGDLVNYSSMAINLPLAVSCGA